MEPAPNPQEGNDQMTSIPHTAAPSRLGQLTRTIARATAPLSRPLAGRRFFPIWAIVHHRGRRSGREYAIPVAIRASAEAFVIPLPWGAQTQWVRNAVAAGRCTIRWRGEDHTASHPRVIGMADAADAFSPVQRLILRAAGVSSFVRFTREVTGTTDRRIATHLGP